VSFPLNAYLLAMISGFVTTVLTLPPWRKWCLRVGVLDEPGQRKIHCGTIPLAGGLAIMSGLLLPTILASIFLYYSDAAGKSSVDAKAISLLQYGLSRRAIRLAGILLGALGMLGLGLLDDKYELRPRTKFLGQFLVAALVAASGVQITLFVHSTIFHYAMTILWIITLINAFNFMDNMNGLCAGLAAIGALYFGLIAGADGQYLVASIAFLAFGALLGFMPYNFPKARAFLGDSGSHLLGYVMAVLAILPHFYNPRHPRRLAVLMPLLVLAVPLIDLVWVVALRWRIGQPFYQGDTNHLSHRVVRLGISPTRAVLIIWLLAAIVGGLAFVIGR
jgi:UDP-GlcNAc:undecaprenyl-phosphate GlcNAc-1-phosphate transferase